MSKTKGVNIQKITVLAVICALAYICTFVLRFKVMFLTFDFKDAVIAVSALVYGPIAGFICSAVVAFIEFITVSETGVYGLIMNFLSSVAFSATAGVVYYYKRTFFGAIFSVATSVLSVVAVMLLANIFITPFYMGVERSEVIALIPSLLLPFNIIKSVMNAALTLVIYKPFTTALGRLSLIERKKYNKGSGKRTVILLICALAVAAIAVLFFVFYLNGEIVGTK